MSDSEEEASPSPCGSSRMSVFVSKPPVTPADFLCPISLELMSDPVILSTGHTYDRKSIEGWFNTGKKTCPQSRNEVSTKELIPNVALKDCIRDWQATFEVPRHKLKHPTSPTLLTELHVRLLLDNIMVEPENLQTLQALQIMSEVNDRNRRLICDGGALLLLGSVLSRSRPEEISEEAACVALGALAALSIIDDAKRQLPNVGLSILPTLSWFLRRGDMDVRLHVVRIIECMVADNGTLLQLGAEEGLVQGLVEMLQHQECLDVTASFLRCLYAICLPARNRRVAIRAGAAVVVIELIPGAKKEVAEGALAIMDLLSNNCYEGQIALSEHALLIPILVRSLFEYTNPGTEHAVNVLHAILSNNIIKPVLRTEAVKSGAIAKLLRVIQVPQSSSDAKLKARELLKSLQITGSDRLVWTMAHK